MIRRLTGVGVVLALAGAAWAGDPWVEKSFREWNEKEVKKILNDSPWSRTIHVSGTWAGANRPGSEPSLGGPGGGGAPATGVGGPASSEGREPQIARVPFQIRWVSSQTIREAMARNAVLQGRAQEADAEKFIEQRPAEYLVAIVGEDMRPFGRAKAEALAQSSHLSLKSTKQKLAPLKVEIRKSQDGKKVNAVVFFFPRTTSAGEPQIAPTEKDVEFYCEVDHVIFRTNFNPNKMSAKEGLDL